MTAKDQGRAGATLDLLAVWLHEASPFTACGQQPRVAQGCQERCSCVHGGSYIAAHIVEQGFVCLHALRSSGLACTQPASYAEDFLTGGQP